MSDENQPESPDAPAPGAPERTAAGTWRRFMAHLRTSVLVRFLTVGALVLAMQVPLGMVEGAAYYLFLHDDVALDAAAVSVLVEEAERSDAAVVGPKEPVA